LCSAGCLCGLARGQARAAQAVCGPRERVFGPDLQENRQVDGDDHHQKGKPAHKADTLVADAQLLGAARLLGADAGEAFCEFDLTALPVFSCFNTFTAHEGRTHQPGSHGLH